jgi:hypothetical protein
MVTQVSATTTIRIGSRVYLRNCVAGEPGCVIGFDHGKAVVTWPDMPEQRDTRHALENLEIDTGFQVTQLGLDFGEMAA